MDNNTYDSTAGLPPLFSVDRLNEIIAEERAKRELSSSERRFSGECSYLPSLSGSEYEGHSLQGLLASIDQHSKDVTFDPTALDDFNRGPFPPHERTSDMLYGAGFPRFRDEFPFL